MSERCIIVGASHAAAQLVPSLRQEGWEGDILLIGDEPHLPYHRPPLSKALLSGDKGIDELAIRPEAFYSKHKARFHQGRVTAINKQERTLSLKGGQVFRYNKLVLCTGSRVRPLLAAGSDLMGVHYLRNIADVEGIKQDVSPGKTAVIIGGGYIGLEAAASLKKQGMNVVVLEAAERILQRVTAPELSGFYARVHEEEGVEIRTNAVVSKLIGRRRVSKVLCTDGTEYPADLVIVGIGVLPNVELAEACGLDVDNGIVVDDFCSTSHPDILAAGDCTSHYNQRYQRQLRLESVPNASEQAKSAAATLCGKQRLYNSLPWFWSDQYDIKLQIAGLSQGYDQVVIRGDKDQGRSFAAFYFREGKLLAADCVNRPQEFMLCKKVLNEGLTLDPSVVTDENKSVKALLAES